jgi:hypothetical protein
MNTGKTLFAQIMDFLPWKTFHRIVARHGGDKGVRSLTCAEQFRAMAFAQLTYRESLRDIEACLLAQRRSCTTWGFANRWQRPWRMPTNRATGAYGKPLPDACAGELGSRPASRATPFTGAKRDLLQEAIALKKSITDFPLQYGNFRD